MFHIDTILKDKKHIHFIGIGGSGIYPIVQILHSKGFFITGSDNNEGDTIDALRKIGIQVFIGQSEKNIIGADVIIYSAAIMQDNPELIAAKNANIPLIERAKMLDMITNLFTHAICIAGTHGKTTTSSMATQILMEHHFDPSAIIGGKLEAIGGNGRVGNSQYMICESCEYKDTFLQLNPDVAVILNIEEDHLEYFKNLENIIASFHKFAALASKSIIINGDDENTRKAINGIKKEVITFGFEPTNDYYPENIILNGMAYAFDLMHKKEKLCTIQLSVPGKHNISNAICACACAISCGATPTQCASALPNYTGAGRRFEKIAQINGITIVDDYAHHPTEITVTLKAAKEMPYRKVWAVFQPFTYSRTSLLLDDFSTALCVADYVVMSEIMGGREHNTYNIYTKDLAEKIPNAVWFETFDEIATYVMSHAQEGDLVLTMGCGDIYKCAKIMAKK